MRVALVVHPRAGREDLRWDGTQLHLWTTRPPVEGAANAEAVRMVAAWLRVPPSRVRLVSGLRGTRKLMEIEGIDNLPD